MIEMKAPGDYDVHKRKTSIFLAGSIEMGLAENWQDLVVRALDDLDILILNPRRAQWDASWEQSIDNPQFREQVEWELDALHAADMVIMYFAPETKSPITLLELGIHAASAPEKLIVCCPQGFWRKGNVDVVCKRYGVRQAASIEDLISETIAFFTKEQKSWSCGSSAF
jgi:hypothetical protein